AGAVAGRRLRPVPGTSSCLMLRHKPPSEQSATQAVTGGSLASASVTCTRTCRRVRGASRRSCGLVSGESGEVGSIGIFLKGLSACPGFNKYGQATAECQAFGVPRVLSLHWARDKTPCSPEIG